MKEAEQDHVITGLVELYTPIASEEPDHVVEGGGEYAAYAGVTLSLGAVNLFFANCRADEVFECYTSSANLFPLVGGTVLTLAGFANLGLAGYKSIKKRQIERDYRGEGYDSLR